MPKKKPTPRRTYNLSKQDVITYGKPSVQRKMSFLVLRGSGIPAGDMLIENKDINAFALKQSVKVKYIQTKTEAEVIAALKDANTWATAVLFNKGNLECESPEFKTAVKKLLIPVCIIAAGEEDSSSAYLEAMQKVLSTRR